MGSAPSSFKKDLEKISRATGTDFLKEMEKDGVQVFSRCSSEATFLNPKSKSFRKQPLQASRSCLDAEDMGMHAIRRYAIERTASARSSPDSHTPFQRAASMPAMRVCDYFDEVASDSKQKKTYTPPKEALLRVLKELSRLKPPASALPYIKWACDECGMNEEFEENKNHIIGSLSLSEELEDEFSLDDMKADSLTSGQIAS